MKYTVVQILHCKIIHDIASLRKNVCLFMKCLFSCRDDFKTHLIILCLQIQTFFLTINSSLNCAVYVIACVCINPDHSACRPIIFAV